MRPKGIIIHCSATLDDNDSQIDITDIDRWHRQNGWDRVGYHYVITRLGIIQKGRAENETGAHCVGHNDTIGICMIGTRKFSTFQIQSLYKLIESLMLRHEFKPEQIHGHNEFAKKECPGFDAEIIRGAFMIGRKQ